MSSGPSARVALVTGGASGIGRATALYLAELGLVVAVGDVCDHASSVAEEAGRAGGRAMGVYIDVTDGDAISAAFKVTRRELGDVEVLVNCAGSNAFAPFTETDEAFWETLIDVNLKGVLRTTAAALPGMIERRFGRIVNVASEAALIGAAQQAVYAGTKGGVISFTKTIAREAARHGVTANCVAPGPIQTPLFQSAVQTTANPQVTIDRITAAVPVKRLGQPREVAAAVAFLASEDAAYITGQTLAVGGGMTMA
jgi:2-hydroxycyclohexanecarboxyl-CoA dehydrogenase